MKHRLPWPWIAPILVYAASALEVVIMVSPFAAYFYSVYTPLLHGLAQFEATAWLPRFFLPHLARTPNLLFRFLTYSGPVLGALGLIGFLVCAVQIYYGKFIKKRLVTGGLYGRVRHPQYLCLAVAGLGFLLMWPRFFVLATYLMMLGLYYLLARHEEEVIRGRYGEESERYMARIPMFNPFRGPADTVRRWRPPARITALGVWTGLVVVSIGLAFLLRKEAVSQLYAAQWSAPNVTAISFSPQPDDRLAAIMQSVLATPPVRALLEQNPDDTLLLQIARGGDELRHLFIDLGMKAGAIQTMQMADQGEYVVVSRVTAPPDRPDPFALTTEIVPLYLVGSQSLRAGLDIQAFSLEQFYPNFSRIVF